MASSSSSGLPTNLASMGADAGAAKEHVSGPIVVFTPLSELTTGGEFTIKALICRSWDAKNPSGKYNGIEYVMSDDKGDAVHAITRSSISPCVTPKLIFGEIYHIQRFTVAPNKELHRLRNCDVCLIYLESNSVIQKLECPTTGFTRHSFQVTRIEDVAYNGNKFLIGEPFATVPPVNWCFTLFVYGIY